MGLPTARSVFARPRINSSQVPPARAHAFGAKDLGREPVPDETTVGKFRHLLEEHGLGHALFDAVTERLRGQGVTVSTGTIVDATIIAAPSSTKNATGSRDPGMHQTQKGRQRYFGMKGHFGVDSQSKRGKPRSSVCARLTRRISSIVDRRLGK